MHVVWKRPDGYHGATPADYRVVQVNDDANIWLHHEDTEWFPFRVSGGWQDEDATKKLNSMINLLDQSEEHWLNILSDNFSHSETDEAETYFKETLLWLQELKNALKGDTWEIDIMAAVITQLESNMKICHKSFISKSKI
jgi:hypothetical protein